MQRSTSRMPSYSRVRRGAWLSRNLATPPGLQPAVLPSRMKNESSYTHTINYI